MARGKSDYDSPEAREVFLGALMRAMAGGNPSDAILDQEARGQQRLAKNQDKLPRDMRGDARQKMEAEGFVFGEDADDLFVYVTMPEGWKIEPTSHSMWSHLIDLDGNKRGSIFYKAAFYDRTAFMDFD